MVTPVKLDPWQRYTPPLPYKKNKVLYRVTISISALTGCRGWYVNSYGISAPSYCISLKNMYGGGV